MVAGTGRFARAFEANGEQDREPSWACGGGSRRSQARGREGAWPRGGHWSVRRRSLGHWDLCQCRCEVRALVPLDRSRHLPHDVCRRLFVLEARAGKRSGLFHNLKEHYPRWILWPTLIGVLIGNTVEAAADLGGMAAAINLFLPVPIPLIVVVNAAVILALQIWGSYELIRNVFRWLALALLAYVGAAVLAKPNLGEVIWGTFVPHIQFSREFLSMLVAVIGTTLSAYLWGLVWLPELRSVACSRRRAPPGPCAASRPPPVCPSITSQSGWRCA
jgi:Natural resistance-associated macrophage protein